MRYFFFCLVLAFPATAQVRLATIFADHMVVQRNQPVRVWGWAPPGEAVQVRMAGQSAQTKAGTDGAWQVTLPALAAGGPHELMVLGKTSLTISDVLVGEVWLCSGQSNMAFTVRRGANAAAEINAGTYPQIRQFTMKHEIALQPAADVPGGDWQVASPETVGDFSAVAYFFARDISRELNVPVGLIVNAWGGTQLEGWLSRKTVEQHPTYRKWLADMPPTLDSALAIQTRRTLNALRTQHAPLPADGTHYWADPAYDDSAWPVLPGIGPWERSVLPGFDGRVWFRKEVDVPAAFLDQAMLLSLGTVDESDETYVNGVRVGGFTNAPGQPRTYFIDKKILRRGKNIIAVRIDDRAGDYGGLTGPAAQMTLSSTVYDFTARLTSGWRYRVARQDRVNVEALQHSQYPTILNSALIAPLRNLPLAGVLWYQGEANTSRAWQYRETFPMLIQDWRQQLGQPDLPFLFVQLAAFRASFGWPELRDAQQVALVLPKTGMAVSTDVGQTDDIHPRNKQDVGKRLARQALRVAYRRSVVADGPQFASLKAETGRCIVSFKTDSNGGVAPALVCKDPRGYLGGFVVAGADQRFYSARADIVGPTVVVSSPAVPNPVAVRYAWTDDPHEANLYNTEGLPAAPFRTDDWPLTTKNGTYKNIR
jgi:sialate O-acetylesterase